MPGLRQLALNALSGPTNLEGYSVPIATSDSHRNTYVYSIPKLKRQHYARASICAALTNRHGPPMRGHDLTC